MTIPDGGVKPTGIPPGLSGAAAAPAHAVAFEVVLAQHGVDAGRGLSADRAARPFACRSHRYTMPQVRPFTNCPLLLALLISGLLQLAVVVTPFGSRLMRSAPVTARDWLLILPLALIPVTLVESWKLFHGWLSKRRRSGPFNNSDASIHPTPTMGRSGP